MLYTVGCPICKAITTHNHAHALTLSHTHDWSSVGKTKGTKRKNSD